MLSNLQARNKVYDRMLLLRSLSLFGTRSPQELLKASGLTQVRNFIVQYQQLHQAYWNAEYFICLLGQIVHRNGSTERFPTLTTWCNSTQLLAEHTTTWRSIQWYVHWLNIRPVKDLPNGFTTLIPLFIVSLGSGRLHLQRFGPFRPHGIQGFVKAGGSTEQRQC